MFRSDYMRDMPALLSDAYGTIFSQSMQNTTPNPKKQTAIQMSSSLGAVASSEDSALDTPELPVKPVVHARPTWREKDGNYEIHITIDRHDCHLLCLFIGVFTLSLLFNSNKRGSSPATG